MSTKWEDIADEEQTGEYKQKTGFDPLPEGTRVLQTLEEIKMDSYAGSDHENLNLKWKINAPEDYAGRVYFQTIYINGSDPTGPYYDAAKQDKNIADAVRMVLAIDYHAGRGIAALGREPEEADFQKHLTGAQMMAVLGVSKTGKQVVRGISGVDKDAIPQAKPQAKTAKQVDKPVDNGFSDDFDPDLLF